MSIPRVNRSHPPLHFGATSLPDMERKEIRNYFRNYRHHLPILLALANMICGRRMLYQLRFQYFTTSIYRELIKPASAFPDPKDMLWDLMGGNAGSQPKPNIFRMFVGTWLSVRCAFDKHLSRPSARREFQPRRRWQRQDAARAPSLHHQEQSIS